jgi:hypothetical protein
VNLKFKKYFTPDEANKTLPLVKKIVKDILNTGHEMNSLITFLGDDTENHSQINQLVEQMNSYFAELEEIGCLYKDWNFRIGLVDFPAIINDREVFLCWRSDESEIMYYHPIETGYSGRKPLEIKSVKEKGKGEAT